MQRLFASRRGLYLSFRLCTVPKTTRRTMAASSPLEKNPKNKKAENVSSSPLEMTPPPAFMNERLQLFERLYQEQLDRISASPKKEIEVVLPSGDKKEALSWQTTPFNIAEQLSKSLSEKVIIAKVNGQLWDLHRVLEESCSLELLDFEHPEGKAVFWHSAAHVLGEAAERHYGCHLCHGPPTKEGFFYDMELPNQGVVHASDYGAIETISKSAVKEKQPFQRLVAKKEDLLKMFHYNKFKIHYISTKVPDGTSSTVYRCGPMIDFCAGPHIPHTGRIKAFCVTKNSSCYFNNNSENETLQRIHGMAFPDAKQMAEYKKFVEEAAKRHHRKIGKEQDLFVFHDHSPGSCFWLPHGTRIYNTLVELFKEQYHSRGYQEVLSPNIFHSALWKQSGHWQHYSDDMFKINIEKEEWGLKPMNCPGHCLIFGAKDRSYRELPLRIAEFGVLHRNEASGALVGLTRLRKFQQDDAHIFCTQDQVEGEIKGLFDFLSFTYGLFGFEFKLTLSTRPEKYLGQMETWDTAEKMLKNTLEDFVPGQWSINEGDGAFYGPKIDIYITDALKREYQCATIQLDYQLPEQFNLLYRTAEGKEDAESSRKRPVMIHRAIAGSIERFTAILIEHFGGKWPFWLSPRQVLVIPVAAPFKEYASEISKKLWDAGIYSDADLSDSTLSKKIRNGEMAQYNFILVVGEEELQNRSVNVRNRDEVGLKNRADKTIKLDDITHQFVKLKKERSLKNELPQES